MAKATGVSLRLVQRIWDAHPITASVRVTSEAASSSVLWCQLLLIIQASHTQGGVCAVVGSGGIGEVTALSPVRARMVAAGGFEPPTKGL